MKRSLYSLILSDDVVSEIDKIAYSMRTNRSSLINQILAEYVSYVTPEQRVKDVFSRLENLISNFNSFQLLTQNSSSMLQMRSALEFKYNPTIKYNVELYREVDDHIGEIRVTMRTQNSNLIYHLASFFSLWIRLEKAYSLKESEIIDNRFVKKIHIRVPIEELDEDTLAQAILDYINVFDKAMKEYFSNIGDERMQISNVNEIFKSYLNTNPIFI